LFHYKKYTTQNNVSLHPSPCSEVNAYMSVATVKITIITRKRNKCETEAPV